MLRFGLNGQQPQTLAEIADYYGISRERVRQIEKEALSKLRRPTSSNSQPQPSARPTQLDHEPTSPLPGRSV
ncbi:MAG: sigma factor-like helix-turn-helix DNA-binding protein [Thermomicrobiales bacterium]